ncbi:hypothetical protein EXN66_Car010614 [Channa argus]|uniref:Uncharacterized protein n=1 Tax=Channa argus TaxID=215402 RepID=A0A6G1PY83_CHAAH|nr:hypothetical protein EXN66_Car010614 [Channa argus]
MDYCPIALQKYGATQYHILFIKCQCMTPTTFQRWYVETTYSSESEKEAL